MLEAEGVCRPAVIELSVLRGRTNRLHPVEWLMLLRLARDFGWEPTGAIAFDREGVALDRDPWYGLTPSPEIAYRSIEGGDVRRLANALSRAASTVARESDRALLEAATPAGNGSEAEGVLTPLSYFVEQGLAADWIEQLADDMTDATTILVHGDITGAWPGVLSTYADGDGSAF